jgi:hypothetical protein
MKHFYILFPSQFAFPWLHNSNNNSRPKSYICILAKKKITSANTLPSTYSRFTSQDQFLLEGWVTEEIRNPNWSYQGGRSIHAAMLISPISATPSKYRSTAGWNHTSMHCTVQTCIFEQYSDLHISIHNIVLTFVFI